MKNIIWLFKVTTVKETYTVIASQLANFIEILPTEEKILNCKPCKL